MDWGDTALRLGTAALIGGAIGLNRYVHHKHIGMRTLGLVAVGSSAIVAATVDAMGADAASRVMQGLVTGIGFLGAGVILHDASDHRVHGLTTAAAVWLAAIVGAICGIGSWRPALLLAVIAGALLLFGGSLERWIARRIGGDPGGHDNAAGDG